jgi:hypothetical protein
MNKKYDEKITHKKGTGNGSMILYACPLFVALFLFSGQAEVATLYWVGNDGENMNQSVIDKRLFGEILYKLQLRFFGHQSYKALDNRPIEDASRLLNQSISLHRQDAGFAPVTGFWR